MTRRTAHVVRDPVHDYLLVAPHELRVVDHPIVQRLRRIAQTGLAELVFPEARTTRFVHSLGAMHLASRFLVAAVSNAAPSVRGALLAGVAAEVEALTEGRVVLAGFDDDALEPLLPAHPMSPSRGRDEAALRRRQLGPSGLTEARVLVFAEAVTRMLALLHDLGHLPFSHDFESALVAYGASAPEADAGLAPLLEAREPPHEVLSRALGRAVLTDVLAEVAEPAARAVLDTTRALLARPSLEGLPHLSTLDSFVHGELDVDRADYLLRDGRALGLDFATYDLDRLLYNLTLAPAEVTPAGRIALAVRPGGVHPVESFLLARGRSHETFIRHPKVAQLGAAFRRATVRTLEAAEGARLRGELGALLAAAWGGDEAAEAARAADARPFAEWDDAAWLCALRARGQAVREGLDGRCFELVRHRTKGALRSPWKRGVSLVDRTVIERANAFAAASEAVALQVDEALRHEGVLIVRHRYVPYRLDAGGAVFRVLYGEGEGAVARPIDTVSAAVRGLREAWDADVHLHAFLAGDDDRSPHAVLDVCDAVLARTAPFRPEVARA